MGRSGGGRSGGGGFSGGSRGGFSGGRSSGGFSSGRSSGGFSGGSRGRSGSSGSFFGSSGRSGRSGGGSSFGRGFGGGPGRSAPPPPPPPRGPRYGGWRGPIIINNSRHYGGGYYGGSGGGPAGPAPVRQAKGCGTLAAVCVVFILILALLFSFSAAGGGGGSVAPSTTAREPLPAGSVTETEYYTDEPGWIRARSTLLHGMESFYRETGVQPHLYIAESVNGSTAPSQEEIGAYADSLYGQLFSDEGHFLLVFCDDGQGGYTCGYTVGRQAKSVMDDEALGIFADYLDYYYTSEMEDEEFFAAAYEKTGERIMQVTRSPWPTLLGILLVGLILAGLFLWWDKARRQKNLEAKQAAEILNTPLEKFGDTEVEDLAKKYQDPPG